MTQADLDARLKIILIYQLIPTCRRLTFDIHYQDNSWDGTEETRMVYRHDNGVEIISQSQMDIQTDRLWILGEKGHTRSGSMVFSDDLKRDKQEKKFDEALLGWAQAAFCGLATIKHTNLYSRVIYVQG
jgi:hypothetical protein